MRVTFIDHRGARVAMLDFTNVTDDAIAIAVIDEARFKIAKEAPASIYTLTDVTGSRVTPRVRTALQQLTKANAPYVIGGAVVGLTAIQTVVFRGIIQITKRRLVAVATRQAALDWIASEVGTAVAI
jgi:hypothetical protein